MGTKNFNTELKNLTPEQKKAWVKFERHYYDRMPNTIIETPFQPNFQFSTGFTGFTRKNLILRTLPHGETWVWNQSNGKIRVNLENERTVVYQKMSARSKPGEGKAPFCKLWVYKIYDNNAVIGTLLWCEKGPENLSKKEIVLPSNNDIKQFNNRMPFQYSNASNIKKENTKVESDSLNEDDINFLSNLENSSIDWSKLSPLSFSER